MMDLLFSVASYYGEGGENWETIWLPLCIAAVIVSILMHNLILMFARAAKIESLERYAKSEMLQAAATAFIAIFLVSLVGSAMELSEGLIHGDLACDGENIRISQGGDQSVMEDALDGIRCRIQDKAHNIADVQESFHVGSVGDTVRNRFYGVGMMVSLLGITVWKGDWSGTLFSFTETCRISNNLATMLLISLNAQAFLVLYIKKNMLAFFLPIGILLRSFHFTRGLGALFMALAIGFYFVFPIVYILLDPGFVSIPLPDEPSEGDQNNFCYPTMSSSVTILNAIETSGFGGTEMIRMDSIEGALSEAYVSLILHPLVSLFITLTFIGYMMNLLQGDSASLIRMVSKVI